MSQLAAIIFGNDRARLIDITGDLASAVSQIVAKYPRALAILHVAKRERATDAPEERDLFDLLTARATPLRLENGWLRCGENAIRKLFFNVLENAAAAIMRIDVAEYRKARKDAEQAVRKHGYVYAFYHGGKRYLKVGMTNRNDVFYCQMRIEDYCKTHALPSNGWSFVGFIACTDALALESKIHSRLKRYRVPHGKARELFQCSIASYESVLDVLDDFITSHAPRQQKVNPQSKPDVETLRRQRESEEARRKAEAERRAEWERQQQIKREEDLRQAERDAAQREAIRRKAEEAARHEREEQWIKDLQRQAVDNVEDAKRKRESGSNSKTSNKSSLARRVRLAIGVVSLVVALLVMDVALQTRSVTVDQQGVASLSKVARHPH